MEPVIRVQREDFDTAAEIRVLTRDNPDIGAVVAFTGLCRDEGNTLTALELEHYPGMAEKEMRRVSVEAGERWPLTGIAAIHRFGRIEPGGNIVLVLAASRHRQAAFDGAAYIMDFLKSRAPFWKREIRRDGSTGEWVDARSSDEDALEKWKAAD